MSVSGEFKDSRKAELVLKLESKVLGSLVASRNIAEIIKTAPSVTALEKMANTEKIKKNFEGVLKILEKRCEVAPADWSGLNDLAWFLVSVEDPKYRDAKRAVKISRKALELTENKDGNVYDTLAVALHELGELKEAVDCSARAAALLPGRSDYVQRAEAYKAELTGATSAPSK